MEIVCYGGGGGGGGGGRGTWEIVNFRLSILLFYLDGGREGERGGEELHLEEVHSLCSLSPSVSNLDSCGQSKPKDRLPPSE